MCKWLQGREELIVAALVLLAACLEEESERQGWKSEGEELDQTVQGLWKTPSVFWVCCVVEI